MSEEKTMEKHAEMISRGDRKTGKSGETGKTGKSGKAGTSKKPGQKRTRVSPAKKKLALEVIESINIKGKILASQKIKETFSKVAK